MMTFSHSFIPMIFRLQKFPGSSKTCCKSFCTLLIMLHLNFERFDNNVSNSATSNGGNIIKRTTIISGKESRFVVQVDGSSPASDNDMVAKREET